MFLCGSEEMCWDSVAVEGCVRRVVVGRDMLEGNV